MAPPLGKQTKCPAGIHFKLTNTENHEHDENCSLFLLEIYIAYIHNHSIESANAVKQHDVNSEQANGDTIVVFFSF